MGSRRAAQFECQILFQFQSFAIQMISNLTIPPRKTKVSEATKLRGAAHQIQLKCQNILASREKTHKWREKREFWRDYSRAEIIELQKSGETELQAEFHAVPL